MLPDMASSLAAVVPPKYVDHLRLLTYYTLHATSEEMHEVCRILRNKKLLEKYLNPDDKPNASHSPGFYALNQIATQERPNPQVLKNIEILVGYGLDLKLQHEGISLEARIIKHFKSMNRINGLAFELAYIDLVFAVLSRSRPPRHAGLHEACSQYWEKLCLSTQPNQGVLARRWTAKLIELLLLDPTIKLEFFEHYSSRPFRHLTAIFDHERDAEDNAYDLIEVIGSQWGILKDHHAELSRFINSLDNSHSAALFETALKYGHGALAQHALRNVKLENEDEEAREALKSHIGLSISTYNDQDYVRKTLVPYLLNSGNYRIWDFHPEFWSDFSLFDKQYQALHSYSSSSSYKNYFFIKRLRLNSLNQEDNSAYIEELNKAITLGHLPEDFQHSFSTPLFLAIQKEDLKIYSAPLLNNCADLVMRVNPSGKEIFHLFYYAYSHLDQVERALKSLQLLNMDIYDRGRSHDQWYPVLEQAINHTSHGFLSRYKSNMFQPNPEPKLLPMGLEDYAKKNHLTYVGRKGRTLLFSKPGSVLYTAIKIAKTNEPAMDLAREKDAQNQYQRLARDLHLLSKFPTGRACKTIQDLDKFLDSILSEEDKSLLCDTLIGDNLEDKVCLIYEAPKKYFNYLYAIKDTDDFQEACLNSISDLCTLLVKKGIFFNTLADMFHNNSDPKPRPDGGRYQVFVGLLSVWKNAGSGRLTGWLRAIEYLNLRESGIADLGDQIQLAEDVFNPESDFVKKYFSDVYKLYPETAKERIFVNIVAEYLYVFLLAIGRRARERGVSYRENAWYGDAEFFVEVCAKAIATMTRLTEEQAFDFLSRAADIKRLGRQMEFWMTPEHIPYVQTNSIPEDIYGPEVPVNMDFEKIRANTFNDQHGFCINPAEGPDLGTVNGQEPIKEANKLLYLTATSILSFIQDEVTPDLLKTYELIDEPTSQLGKRTLSQ